MIAPSPYLNRIGVSPAHFPLSRVCLLRRQVMSGCQSSPLDKPRKSSYIRNMNFSSVFIEARCGGRNMEGVPAPLNPLSMTDRQTGLGGGAHDQTNDDETLATTGAGRAADCCHFTGGCPGVL